MKLKTNTLCTIWGLFSFYIFYAEALSLNKPEHVNVQNINNAESDSEANFKTPLKSRKKRQQPDCQVQFTKKEFTMVYGGLSVTAAERHLDSCANACRRDDFCVAFIFGSKVERPICSKLTQDNMADKQLSSHTNLYLKHDKCGEEFVGTTEKCTMERTASAVAEGGYLAREPQTSEDCIKLCLVTEEKCISVNFNHIDMLCYWFDTNSVVLKESFCCNHYEKYCEMIDSLTLKKRLIKKQEARADTIKRTIELAKQQNKMGIQIKLGSTRIPLDSRLDMGEEDDSDMDTDFQGKKVNLDTNTWFEKNTWFENNKVYIGIGAAVVVALCLICVCLGFVSKPGKDSDGEGGEVEAQVRDEDEVNDDDGDETAASEDEMLLNDSVSSHLQMQESSQLIPPPSPGVKQADE